MKQSFIFEKRNITFGKILMSNKVTLYFTLYVFINYITNIYFTYELNKCFDSDYCKNNKNNSMINYFSTKIYYNHIIIKCELLLLLLLVFYRIKINYNYEYIINCNVLLYFLTPLYNHFYFINNNIYVEQSILLDNTRIRSIYLYYLESDLLSSILIFIPILFLLGFIFNIIQILVIKYIINNILYYYHKNIENIPIEYTEIKLIEIDKIV